MRGIYRSPPLVPPGGEDWGRPPPAPHLSILRPLILGKKREKGRVEGMVRRLKDHRE
jgi:hypothetical protein